MKLAISIIIAIAFIISCFFLIRQWADQSWYKQNPELNYHEPFINTDGSKDLDRLFFEQNRNWFDLLMIFPITISFLFVVLTN